MKENDKRYSHGLAHHLLYKTWASMMNRCYNPKDPRYDSYGGRGIIVCQRWHDIRNFISDMTPKIIGCTVDRINNDGPYELDNCRWATPIQQQNNGRLNVKITWKGEIKTIAEWARILGIHPDTLQARHERKWTVERMMTQPIDKSIQVRQPRKEKKP